MNYHRLTLPVPVTYYLLTIHYQAVHMYLNPMSRLFRHYEVPYYEYAVKEDLGRCIGKQYRASLAVTDSGFAKALESKILSGEKIE